MFPHRKIPIPADGRVEYMMYVFLFQFFFGTFTDAYLVKKNTFQI